MKKYQKDIALCWKRVRMQDGVVHELPSSEADRVVRVRWAHRVMASQKKKSRTGVRMRWMASRSESRPVDPLSLLLALELGDV